MPSRVRGDHSAVVPIVQPDGSVHRRGSYNEWASDAVPDALRQSTGTTPTAADTVRVHYHGTLRDGTVFDSSVDRGEPATFPLGRLVKAWQMAIPQMGVADTIEIATPADLAYGPAGKGPIPGGATLLFTVKLLAIEPAT